MRFNNYDLAREAAQSIVHWAEVAKKSTIGTTRFQQEFHQTALQYALEDVAYALGYTLTKKEDDNG